MHWLKIDWTQRSEPYCKHSFVWIFLTSKNLLLTSWHNQCGFNIVNETSLQWERGRNGYTKEKSQNFNVTKKEILPDIVDEYKHILEDKRSDMQAISKKNMAFDRGWEKVLFSTKNKPKECEAVEEILGEREIKG